VTDLGGEGKDKSGETSSPSSQGKKEQRDAENTSSKLKQEKAKSRGERGGGARRARYCRGSLVFGRRRGAAPPRLREGK